MYGGGFCIVGNNKEKCMFFLGYVGVSVYVCVGVEIGVMGVFLYWLIVMLY